MVMFARIRVLAIFGGEKFTSFVVWVFRLLLPFAEK